MGRRFVTAEDLRRLQGRELVIDEDTVVTPQALELARELGIALRTGRGDYKEPVPDRGPDAARAATTLPHLPEPDPELAAQGPIGVVVSAVGKNRPGILAEITGALGRHHANVESISQQMLEGYFHLMLTVTAPAGTSFGALKSELQCLGGEDDYVVRVMHERVFRFMHRV